jgi:four helix bundle protein
MRSSIAEVSGDTMQNFRNLKVWEKAHSLTLDVYASSRTFPRAEIYGLTSQMRRASTFIGANIAEGCCRKGDMDMGRFLQIAMGSASELEYHCVLARDLSLLDPGDYERLTAEVVEMKRMLASLMHRLRADS